MDLEFTEEQEELRRSIRDFLDAECPMSLVRQSVESRQPANELAAAMEKLDWPALVVPEEHGGIGGGPVELAILAEELGRALAPVPLLPTLSQFVPVVQELGSPEQRERFLRPVAESGASGVLALADHPARWELDEVTSIAEPRGDRWVLRGEKFAVTAGPEVDEVAVVARVARAAAGADGGDGGGGLGVFVVPGDQLDFDARPGIDATQPLSCVRLDGVEVGADRALGEPGTCGEGLRRAVEVATTSLSLETVGACDVLFETVRQHALDRHQFGVPIGSFQAVKHKLADDFVSLARARSLALFAVATLEEDDVQRAVAVSMAKAAADDCQRLVTQDGIQTLGGIGFTWEHDAHLYVKRAKSCAALFGKGPEHRWRVAAALGLRTGR